VNQNQNSVSFDFGFGKTGKTGFSLNPGKFFQKLKF
jgi:hypothetical protein